MGRKILHLTSTYLTHDGAAQCLIKIVRHELEKGYEPAVIFPKEGPASDFYKSIGVPVYIIPYLRISSKGGWKYRAAFPWKFFRSARQMARLIRQEGIDLVHVNEIIDFNGLMAAKWNGIPSIMHVRLILERPAWLKSILTRAALHYADRILCVSDAVRQMMFSDQDPGQVKVLYDGGPDMERFDPSKVDPKAIRESLNIPGDMLVVGMVSKIARVKGQDCFLKVAARLRQRLGDKVRFVMVGGPLPNHEDFHSEVLQLEKQLGLQDCHIWAGPRDEVPDLLAAFDIYCHLPNYQEPFPGVVLEAMAMQCPVVAWDSGGIREQFENGVSGMLTPKDDLDAVADAMEVLARDEQKRKKMGQAAREYLLSHFTLNRHFKEMEEVYSELLNSKQ